MQPIIITTILDENHELFLKLKLPDMPPGPVEVVIVSRPLEDADQYEPGSIGWAREKLRAAGLLAEDHYPDALAVSEEELRRLGQIFADERPMSDLIDEDREERF